MLRHLKTTLFICVMITFSLPSYSQMYNARRNRAADSFADGLKIQLKGGINMFYGDLVSDKTTSYTGGIAIEKDLLPYLSFRTDLNVGTMHGKQYTGDITSFYFDNTFFQLSPGLSFTPLNLALGYYAQRLFQPYVIAQFTILQYSANEYWGHSSSADAIYQYTEGEIYRNAQEIAPGLTFGGGVSFYVSNSLQINAELTGTAAFSDELDAHSAWYSGLGTANEVIHYSNSNDFYYIATIGITYSIGNNRWINSSKYNRKTFQRMNKPPKNKNTKRYNRR